MGSLLTNHLLIDAWSINLPEKGFTYHSQAYKNAWDRLDKLFIVDTSWYPPMMEVNVDCSSHMSDHFPVIVTLSEHYWKLHMSGCSMKIPMMINNLHLENLCLKLMCSQFCITCLI